jgi:hypothetical protein
MVDFVSDVRIEVAERIVRKRRQMDDRVEAGEIAPCDVPHILADRRHVGDPPTPGKRAALVEIAVQPGDIVPGCEQYRDHYRADIALVTRDQHFHGIPPDWFSGAD